MKKFLLFSTIVLAAILVYVLFFMSPEEENFIPGKNEIIPDQYIVFMKESFEEPVIKNRKNDPDRKKQQNDNKADRDKKEKKIEDFIKGKGVKPGKILKKFADLKVGAVIKVSATKAAEIKADPNVEEVIQDVNIQINPIQQSDPDININPIQQWRSEPIPETQIKPIQQSDQLQLRYDIDPLTHMTYALATAGGPTPGDAKTTVIWFLDTGIDPTHPNLNVKRDLGASFVYGNNNPDDDHGHGTFCAGAAAGKPITDPDPQIDIIHIGVSEGASVVPVKVLDKDGRGSWGTVIAGLNFVAQMSQPGDVVNLSLGSYDPMNPYCWFPAIKRAIEDVTSGNVYVTLSAGNDAGNASCNRPGCIDGANIFTVSSINRDNTCAVYANFGPSVDYVTVGTRVFSLWMNKSYIMASGTSVSSAILAGIIHARAAEPATSGNVNCMSLPFKIATR